MLQKTENQHLTDVARTARLRASSRFQTVFSYDFLYNAKRPFYWIWFVLMLWNAWLMSMGIWFIRSVDTAVGTEKSFVNSEFQIAFVFALLPGLLLGLFMAIATGTPLIRDAQQKVNDILNTTSLRPWEYIWGKFLAAMASSLSVIVLFVLSAILLNEVIPNPISADIHGPFHLRHYVMPTVVFLIPMMFFVSGVCFAISEFTRKAFLVYLFPVALLLFITQRFGIPSVQYLALEFYCPRIMHAALEGVVAPYSWNLLAAMLLAVFWTTLATSLFRRRGWQ